MNRRRYLAAAGAGLAGFAGCLGGPGENDSSADPGDDDPNDGYPPAFESTPTQRTVTPASFSTATVDGVDVPLAPIDVTHYWYKTGNARFVDARGPEQYDRSHIYGAVLSPAPDGGTTDPVTDWPKEDRIVCYCGCPHHLSAQRAASLLNNGYERVFVIDEGFWEWKERGYPMAGSNVTAEPAVQSISGQTAPEFIGKMAWAWHEPTGQREAAPIGEDGSYTLELRFADMTADSVIAVETPAYRIEAPLAEMATKTVTRSGLQ